MSRRCTPSSVRAAAALAGVARRCGADSKSWNAPSPIPALRAPRRRVFPRRAKRRGSWLRPPPGQRACGLQAVDFFTQQLVAHAQIGDQGFQPLGLFVLHIGFPRSQVGFAAVQKLIPPAGQGRGGYPQFAREGFQILAAQQPQDRCRLAFGRPASPPVAPLFGSPSGRPTGSLRGPRSWFSLFAHRHLHVIPHSFSPQFGVQENPRARELLISLRTLVHVTPYEYALKWIRNQPIGRPFELWELYAAVRIASAPPSLGRNDFKTSVRWTVTGGAICARAGHHMIEY